MDRLYPLRLERRLSPRIWGGSWLPEFLDLPEPWQAEEPLGESWQVYAENRILNGHLAGRTLAEVSQRYGAALLGTTNVSRYGTKFPLLAKFIDAADRLSVQVHPDDAYAARHEAHTGHLGKTEAWYILYAAPDASIVWGFKDALSRDELRRAVEEGRLEPHLNIVPVRAGDVIYNPAGTVHAIGARIFLFEIQQSSDLTYRLYDYDRRDASGAARELHVDKALEVADRTPGQHAKVTPRVISAGKSELLKVEHFAVERWDVSGIWQEATSAASFEILSLTEGKLTLVAGENQLALGQGESVVLPASTGNYNLRGRATVLRCYVPG